MTMRIPRRSFLIGASQMAVVGVATSGLIQRRPGGLDTVRTAETVDETTDIAGVHAEYRSAVASWPYRLPEGETFPDESSLRDDPEAPSEWERGAGEAEALGVWTLLTARSAHAAHVQGNESVARLHLETLASAYQDAFVRDRFADPGRSYLFYVVLPALNDGDFGPLVKFHEL